MSTPAAGAPSTDQGAAPASSTPSSAQTAPAAGASPMAPAATADTPPGSPPATYPICTHKGEDRCMQRGGAHEEAEGSKMHHKKHMMHAKKHMKATKSDTTAAPASPAAGASTGPGM